MEFKLEKTNGSNVIILDGRLDTVTSVDFTKFFEEKKDELLGGSEEKVILDFTNLEYISSAGLRALIALKKALTQVGKDLEVSNINNVVREVFDVTGIGKIIKIN